MPSLSPTLRLSLGLTLLTISLLLVGDMLGLVPNQTEAELRSRRAIAESLAVQVSADVSDGRMGILPSVIEALKERNDGLTSIAVRLENGRLIAATEEHEKLWDPVTGAESTSDQLLVPIYSEHGRWGHVEVRFSPIDGWYARLIGGQSVATIVFFLTIAGFASYWLFLKRALYELDPSSVVPDRVHRAMDILAEGLVILDRSARVLLVNSSFERKLDKSREKLVGTSLSALLWVDDQKLKVAEDDLPWQVALDNNEATPSSQIGLLVGAGQHFVFDVSSAPIHGPNGNLRGVIVTFDDVTEIQKKNTELETALLRLEESQREISRQNHELYALATRDPLTGVLNRRSFFEGMKTLMRECEEHGEPMSAIMVDIDHFKRINDRFGHAQGDKVIKMLADILTQTVRSDDLVGRYGGEEFCVALPGVHEEKASEIAEQMRRIIQEGKAEKFTSAIKITSSFGVSMNDGDGLTPGSLVDLADKALYEAKESGRNRVVRWSQLGRDDVEVAASVAAQKLDKEQPARDSDRGDSSRDVSGSMADASCGTAELLEANEKLQARVDELEKTLVKQMDGNSAGYDETLGLPSRVVLMDRIRQSMERSRRDGRSMAVLSIDIDAVRLVSNMQGSGAADKLMNIVRTRLRNAVRSVDTLAVPGIEELGVSVSSVGNGEFVLLLTDMRDVESTTWVVQRIFKVLREVVTVDGHEILLDARVGASLFPNDTDDADELLAFAGTALRETKLVIEQQVCLYYSKLMNERAENQLRLQSQLALAMERDELFLEYQPSIELREGGIVGFEALLRWRNRDKKLIRPDVFIPIAEHSGLIHRLGDWVAEMAAVQLKAWHDAGFTHLKMAINVSALQFRRDDLIDRLTETVSRQGLEPAHFIIEITESVLIQHVDSAVAMIKVLSSRGFKIALDDFGTGYSSLSYLRRVPVDTVKIDRSFLRDFPIEPTDTEIISAIVSIAHNLGLGVVAEGVETARQLAILQRLDCDQIQGYLLSKPLSARAASELLGNPSQMRRVVRNGNRHNALLVGGSDESLSSVISHLRSSGLSG